MEISIRKAQTADARRIAQIHLTEINQGFLSSLGLNFLEVLYSFLIEDSNSFTLIAQKQGETIGFVCGTTSLNRVYLKLVYKKLPLFLITLAPKLLQPKNIRKILETLLYPKKIPQNLPLAEILSIAVTHKYQRMGIGTELFNLCVGSLKKVGIVEVKIIVGENLINSQKMLSSIKAQKVGTFNVHHGAKSFIYISRA